MPNQCLEATANLIETLRFAKGQTLISAVEEESPR